MSEREPHPYQFKHAKRVYLDQYKGVASDIMDVNDPVTDGFMRVSDMRGDIVIMQKLQERTRDYDQIGTVRVAKFLQMPRIDIWNTTNNRTQIRKEDDVWLVAINDQELAQDVSRSEKRRKFDEAYVDAFQKEVKMGIKECLKKEKFLNGGEYNLAFLASYWSLIMHDLLVLPATSIQLLSDGSSPVVTTAKTASLYAAAHILFNLFNLISAGIGKISGSDGIIGGAIKYPEYKEPFIKHTLYDIVMPTVPVDRLIRGTIYLRKYGKELINKSETV